MKRTAILVDGGFYRKQAKYLFGSKTPEQRANELIDYCHRHLKETHNKITAPVYRELYRIFYYDCKPEGKTKNSPHLRQLYYSI